MTLSATAPPPSRNDASRVSIPKPKALNLIPSIFYKSLGFRVWFRGLGFRVWFRGLGFRV